MRALSRLPAAQAAGPGAADSDVKGAGGTGAGGTGAAGTGAAPSDAGRADLSVDGPLDVLVVGWFPGADDQIAGRFVADQAAALLTTGRVRPSVVSFEPFPLHGDLRLREAAAGAWPDVIRSAAADGRAFAAQGAHGPAGVPVARIGTPVGGTGGDGRTNQALHRATALAALLDGSPVGGRGWSLLHAHVGYPEGAAVAAVARRLGLAMILTEHATYLDRLFADPQIRVAYLHGAESADRIVAVSRVLEARIRAEFPSLAARTVVIPNTVDIDAFRPVGVASRDPNELLWVGYRREVKGTGVLLRAFQLVHAVRPEARLRLIGRSVTPEEEAAWHTLAADLGVADAVSFEAPADRATVALAMERAALFVHPSRTETMGIVAVEALAAGLPVVAVDSGGVTEVLGVDPDRVGALVPKQEPEAIAAAILTTLDRRASFDPHRLRAHVAERYGAAPVAARIADLYDEVLRERAAGTPLQTTPEVNRRIGAPRSILLGEMVADDRVVVVGFESGAVEMMLAAFPAAAMGSFQLVTGSTPMGIVLDAITLQPGDREALAELLRISGRARRGGLAGTLLAPPRWLVRSWRRARLARRVLPVLTRAIEQAAERVTGAGASRPPVVVCLGGIDIVAVEPLRVAGRVVVAPGGPRWLGDRRGVQAEAANSR